MTGERGLDEPEAGEAPELDAGLPSDETADDAETAADGLASELDSGDDADPRDDDDAAVDEALDAFADDDFEADLPDEVFVDDADESEDSATAAAHADEPDVDPADADADAVEPESFEPWEPPVRRYKWARRLLGLVVVGVPAVVAAVVIGQAAGLGGDSADVDPAFAGALRYDAKGNPVVLEPTVDDIGTAKRYAWQVCGNACDKVSGRGTSFRPGEVLAGSRVRVRVDGTSGSRTLTTPGWDGQLRVLQRPALVGQPTVGTIATATAGKWTGGWLDGTTNLGLRACPTRAGGGKCVAFTASILQPDGHKPARTIPASFKGWYIGAIEWQVAPGRTAPAKPLTDPSTPADAEQAPQRGATVALGPLNGPIR